MRFKLLALLLLASICRAAGVVTLATTSTQFAWPNSTALQAITIPATTIGDLVVVGYGNGATKTDVVSTISGGGVTTWTKLISSATVADCEIWYGLVDSGAANTTVTITASTGATTNRAQIGEFASTTGWNASPAGNSASATGSGSSTITTGSITPGESNDLIVAVSMRNGRTINTSPASPWSNFPAAGGTTQGLELSWQQQGAAAAITVSWALSGGTNWDAEAGNFKIAVAAGGARACGLLCTGIGD